MSQLPRLTLHHVRCTTRVTTKWCTFLTLELLLLFLVCQLSPVRSPCSITQLHPIGSRLHPRMIVHAC
jgi:uncharacterized membrane protein